MIFLLGYTLIFFLNLQNVDYTLMFQDLIVTLEFKFIGSLLFSISMTSGLKYFKIETLHKRE